MPSLLAVRLAASPILVDPGVRELDLCDLEVVAFRTPTDVWVSDACGRLFHSSDAGASFLAAPDLEEAVLGRRAPTPPTLTNRRLTQLVWLSPEVGVAIPNGTSRLRLTTDAGRSWVDGAVATGRVLAVASQLPDLWVCDASGRIRHSKDAGASWLAAAPALFEPLGTGANSCVSVTFTSSSDGLALGATSLWRTHNAGASWAPVPVPQGKPGDRTRRFARLLVDGARWSLVDLAGRVFRTDTQGGNWVELSAPAALPDDSLTALTASLRAHPPHTPATGETWAVEQVVRGAEASWGTKGAAVFTARGDGPWVRLTDLPEASDGLILGRRDEPLVHTSSGLLRRSGHGWVKASPADEVRWRKATEPAAQRALGATPLDCLQHTPGFVDVSWVVQECFGAGPEGRALLEVGTDGAHLLVTEGARRATQLDRSISTGETQALVHQLARAAFTEEAPSDCQSNTGYEAHLRFRCGGEPVRELTFVTNQCAPTEGAQPDVGYARAIAVMQLFKTLARSAGGRPLHLQP